jgi:hypothetical protein
MKERNLDSGVHWSGIALRGIEFVPMKCSTSRSIYYEIVDA